MSLLQLFDKKFFKTVIGFGAILAVVGIVLSVAGYYYESNLRINKVTTQATVINSVQNK